MSRNIPYTFSFEDVALVPSHFTVDEKDVDISFQIDKHHFALPLLASAMDAIVDVKFAKELSSLGGLAPLNLEGIHTRYEDVQEAINRIINATDEEALATIREVYSRPIKEELVYNRIKELKNGGIDVVAAAATPSNTEKFIKIAEEASCDIFIVQSTVTTAKYISKESKSLSFKKLKKNRNIPIVVGNCVSYKAAYELMRENIDGILVGVGPGAACTTRTVLGIGMPQISAIMEVKKARSNYYKKSKKYIPIIADGGMRTSADIAKAIAAGADAVMVGSILAKAREAIGGGYNWGMATSDINLSRGKRIYVGENNLPLKQILFGPAISNDGTTNLIGALKQALGVCGARNIRELHKNATIVVATSFLREGKL